MLLSRNLRRYSKLAIYLTVIFTIYLTLELLFDSNPDYDLHLERKRGLNSRFHSSSNFNSSITQTDQLELENFNLCQNSNPISTYYTDLNPEPKLKHVKNVLENVFNAVRTTNFNEAQFIWYWYFPFSKKPRNNLIINRDTLRPENQILNSVPGTNFFTTKEYFVTNFQREYIPEAHVAITPYLRRNVNNYKWVIKGVGFFF